MTIDTVFVRGLDPDTGKIVQVPLAEDFTTSLKNLFKTMYGKAFAGVQWWAGAPEVDRAVVWKGTTYAGAREHFLHVSYSDGRVWS